ncbi:MAG: hypothetical protein U0R26_09115 [Solirubrobacterales bacterium]
MLDDLTTLVGEIEDQLEVVMVSKVEDLDIASTGAVWPAGQAAVDADPDRHPLSCRGHAGQLEEIAA